MAKRSVSSGPCAAADSGPPVTTADPIANAAVWLFSGNLAGNGPHFVQAAVRVFDGQQYVLETALTADFVRSQGHDQFPALGPLLERPAGLLASLRSASATLIDIVLTRIELVSAEFDEEKARVAAAHREWTRS